MSKIRLQTFNTDSYGTTYLHLQMVTNIYYIYILQCSDGTFYTGMTNCIERRMEEHEKGINETGYTHDRRPFLLVHYEYHSYVNNAIAREKQIKNWSRAKKIALINGDLNVLKELSRCNNSSTHINFEFDKGMEAARKFR